jgi:TP901 family phage tail tape measure protein
VSEQLTAVWNGYKVNAAEAERYVDKLSAVARTTAADLEELSIGMSRVASAANIMGVDVDQLNAQLATIVSVTREAPETIGTALKTVYARMSDIQAGLDGETTLDEYTAQMALLGFNALDAQGNLRDMGEVVEEIGDNWDTLSRNQQVALAQTIAGTRQYSRMMALFDNWEMYQSSKATSQNSVGELQKQQEIYLDSMEAHLNKLTAESQELYQTLMDPEGLNPLIDGLTTIVGLVENVVEGLGGGAGALGVFGAIGLNVFGDQITKGITRSIRNIAGFRDNIKQAKSEFLILQELGLEEKNLGDRERKLVDAA